MPERSGFEVAIVGMACRFPGAPDLTTYWNVLRSGAETITFFGEDELLGAGVDRDLLSRPDYVRARGVLADAEMFDAEFFDIAPNEAAVMDPQHRLLLELCWTALEHSGHMPERFDGVMGVYAGTHENSYAARLSPSSPVATALGAFATKIGVEKDYQATRVSYKLGLGGPSLSVQTACSSSLVATHLAVQGLLAGDCDLALAGGVTVHAAQRSGYLYEPGGIFSPDGHCRSFDAQAAGAVSSSGGGVVVLRRLDDALADGDTIHAVILGSAVTNDGAQRVGYTAPGVNGQTRVIRAAQAAAGVAPETIGYVEAHGSGTRLGDPIEVAALTNAFREGTDRTGFCYLGSVKSNIGHTHAAAGVAGLVKTVLALRHGQIPASVNFSRPNPRIDFESSPFRVCTQLTEWPDSAVRRAGVSSFGLGGTNAHLIVEEAPQPSPRTAEARWEVITISARSATARAVQEQELGELLAADQAVNVGDVAHTLQCGRRPFEHRSAVVARDAAEAAAALSGRAPGRLRMSLERRSGHDVAFLLPGVGDLRAGLGRELHELQPVFREAFDACADILRPTLHLDLRALLFNPREQAPAPDLAALLGRRVVAEKADDPLVRTLVAQPATFAFQYAMAQLWLSWGVRPSAMLGYSIGELAAACLAGVFRLEDALMVVTERARLIERTPAGAMLAVPLAAGDLQQRLRGDVWLAAEEGPALCIVAGTREAVRELADRLAGDGVFTRPVRAEHAFHTPLLAGVAREVSALVSGVERKPPGIPYLSNVTGGWITDDDAVSSDYWARHLCQPVQLASGLAELSRRPGVILLDVGPGQALASAALQLQAGEGRAAAVVIASMPNSLDDKPEASAVLTASAKLWLAGVDIDWPATRRDRRPSRVPLPTYPFQRRRHWIEPADADLGVKSITRDDPSGWFTVPAWVCTPPPPDPAFVPGRRWLLIPDGQGVGRVIAERLRTGGEDAVIAEPDQDIEALVAELAAGGRLPDVVVHLGSVYGSGERVHMRDTDACLQDGFFSLLTLARHLATYAGDHPLHLAMVTTGALQVTGEDVVRPGNAAVLGPCLVLPKENPQWTTRCIDVRVGSQDPAVLAEQLVRELAQSPAPQVLAYRGTRRWLQELRSMRIDPPRVPPARLRPGGRYVVLGGFGGIGLTLAGFLAEQAGARLALVGRVPLPPVTEWDDWLAAHSADDRVSRRITAVRDLQARGGEVLPVCADVTELDQMRAALRLVEERFGGIDGVIHAAGVLTQGLAQLKDPAIAAAAMSAKTRGTVVLDTLLAQRRVDFVVLCSSTVGIFGGIGQVDYCAANAFLDAYAQRAASQTDRFIVSIDWDGWQHVGMVARAARAETLIDELREVRSVTSHPLLDARQAADDGRAVFYTDLEPSRHWILDEHRMHGFPVVAGTVYLELVVGALRELGHDWPLELRDVAFLAPCVVPDGTSRRLHLILEPNGDGYRFAFTSRSAGAGSPMWIQHVSGRVLLGVDADDMRPPSGVGDTESVRVPPHTSPMTLRGRSQCLGEVRVRGEWASAQVILPHTYRADLAALALHPSLLDIATGFVNMHLSPTFRMPLAYARIHVAGSLPAEFTSHVRTHAGGETHDLATYDVVLTDADGRAIVRVHDLTMKRPADLRGRLGSLADGTAKDLPGYRPATGHDKQHPLLLTTPGHGLTPEEGIAAFARVLDRGISPQVIVAPRAIEVVQAELCRRPDEFSAVESATPVSSAPKRAALLSEYVAPRTDLERELVQQWERLLGTSQIGVHDNFSELGGHSLYGVRLASLIRETYRIDIALSDLLSAPTVAELADLITRAQATPS